MHFRRPWTISMVAAVALCAAAVSVTLMSGACQPNQPSGGAGGGGAAGGVVVDSQNGTFELFTNPAEPRLYSFSGSTGEVITAFGQKDDTGLATSLDALFMQEPDQLGSNQGTWGQFDDQGQLTRIIGPDARFLRDELCPVWCPSQIGGGWGAS